MRISNFSEYVINESVYGSYVTGYHRSKSKDIVDIIKNGKFSSERFKGSLFATTELKDQFLPETIRKDFGNYIVKIKIPTYNFLFFYFNDFKNTELYKNMVRKGLDVNKKNFILYQFKHFNLPIIVDDDYYDSEDDLGHYQGDLSILFYNYNPGEYISGCVYNSHGFGKNIWCYKTDKIYAMSYLNLDDYKVDLSRIDDPSYIKEIESNFIKNDLDIDYAKKHFIKKNNEFYERSTINKIGLSKMLKVDPQKIKIDKDGKINVDGTIHIGADLIKNDKLTRKFGIVTGDVYYDWDTVRSMDGFPINKGSFIGKSVIEEITRDVNPNSYSDIKDFTTIRDGLVDCDGDILISNRIVSNGKLKYNFGKINGDVIIKKDLKLISQDEMPKHISGKIIYKD